jgi:hypothetical protein
MGGGLISGEIGALLQTICAWIRASENAGKHFDYGTGPSGTAQKSIDYGSGFEGAENG